MMKVKFPTRMGKFVNFSATQEAAAHKIAPKLSVILESHIDPYTLHLWPARGYWTHLHQDVMRFTGSCPNPELPKLSFTFGSWELTLSEIAKGCRFEIHDNRDDHRRLDDFDINRC